jgi:very-short-patch-repair endonuclease
MARRADPVVLAEALDTTLHRQLASPASVLASLRRAGAGPGRAGAVMLRAALEPWLGGIEPGSPAEARLLRRLEDWGFPPPQLQHEVVTPIGRFRLDVAWPTLFAALEYDGVEHHGPRQLAADVRREDALRAAGWWIGRVDRHDLAPSSTRVRDELVERLADRAA